VQGLQQEQFFNFLAGFECFQHGLVTINDRFFFQCEYFNRKDTEKLLFITRESDMQEHVSCDEDACGQEYKFYKYFLYKFGYINYKADFCAALRFVILLTVVNY